MRIIMSTPTIPLVPLRTRFPNRYTGGYDSSTTTQQLKQNTIAASKVSTNKNTDGSATALWKNAGIAVVPALLNAPTITATTTTTTTIAPTTIAPTTIAPTTIAPTTIAPTTIAPTTIAPTTIAPTTIAPTTIAPTTIAPTTIAYQTSADLWSYEVNNTAQYTIRQGTSISLTLVASSTSNPELPYLSLNPAGGAISLTNYRFRSDGSIYLDCSQNATCIIRDGQDTYTLTALSNGQHSLPPDIFGYNIPTTFSATTQFLEVRLPLAKISVADYRANPIGFWWFRIN
jgi:hypothetical protein